MTWLNAPSGKKEDRLAVRAAEHNAVLPCGDGEEVSETCTLITTLLDHQDAPAGTVREAYLTRWSASETTFGEDKTTITGAGNRTSGPVLRSGSPRLVISEAWAWLTATQLVRASAAAALRSEAAAARAQRRKDNAPVTADEESFTAVRHHAIRSMTSSQVTASSSLNALAAAADAAARAALHILNVPGRQRHSRRAQKARPKFAHTSGTKATITGKPEVTVFAPGFSLARRQDPGPAREEGTPAPRGRGPWNRAPDRRDTRAETVPGPDITKTDSKKEIGHQSRHAPARCKHLKSVVLGIRGPAADRNCGHRTQLMIDVVERCFEAECEEDDPRDYRAGSRCRSRAHHQEASADQLARIRRRRFLGRQD